MSLTQIQLANALGLSQPAVSRCVKQGMPVDSIESARHWRECNLHPGHAKPAPRAPSLSALLEEAEALLDMGGDVNPLLPDLRRALRQVPTDQRAGIAMSEPLWHSLTAPMGHVFETERGATLTPAEAGVMGGFWYALAAGEPWMP